MCKQSVNPKVVYKFFTYLLLMWYEVVLTHKDAVFPHTVFDGAVRVRHNATPMTLVVGKLTCIYLAVLINKCAGPVILTV